MQHISFKVQSIKPTLLCSSLSGKLGKQKLLAMTIANGQEGPCLLFKEVLQNQQFELVAVFPSLSRLMRRKQPAVAASLGGQDAKRAGNAIYRWMVSNNYDVKFPEEFEAIANSVDDHASRVAYAISESKGSAPRTLKMPASF